MNMSPSTATPGDDEAEQRAVRAHAADVDREQHGDEGERPAAIDGRTRLLRRFDLGRQGHGLRLVVEPSSLITDSWASGGGVDRRHHDVPGDAGDPQGAGDGDDPREHQAAREQQQDQDRGVAERGKDRPPPLLAARPPDRTDRVAEHIQAEPSGDEEPEGVARPRRGALIRKSAIIMLMTAPVVACRRLAAVAAPQPVQGFDAAPRCRAASRRWRADTPTRRTARAEASTAKLIVTMASAW